MARSRKPGPAVHAQAADVVEVRMGEHKNVDIVERDALRL